MKKEALDFSVKVLDGTKEFVNLYKDSPVPVPEDYNNKIIHASVTFHDGNPETRQQLCFLISFRENSRIIPLEVIFIFRLV